MWVRQVRNASVMSGSLLSASHASPSGLLAPRPAMASIGGDVCGLGAWWMGRMGTPSPAPTIARMVATSPLSKAIAYAIVPATRPSLQWLSLEEFALLSGVHPDLIRRLV